MSAEREAARAIVSNRAKLVHRLVNEHQEFSGREWTSDAPPWRKSALPDVGYHLDHLAAALEFCEPALFVRYAAWAKPLYESRQLGHDLGHSLRLVRSAVANVVEGPSCEAACAYLDTAVACLPDLPTTVPSFLDCVQPLPGVTARYMDSVLAGEPNEATRVALTAIDEGMPVRDVLLRVLQPVQREIGRMWQLNLISALQEQLCTVVTQLVMARIRGLGRVQGRNGRVLLARPHRELHDVGLRMVADFFEMAGWEALVVQAENSAEELLAQLGNPGAEVVGISVTQAINLGAAAELIRRIRSAARNPVRVLVGGYAFHQLPLLWQSLGADGTAANASEAVVLAGAQDAP